MSEPSNPTTEVVFERGYVSTNNLHTVLDYARFLGLFEKGTFNEKEIYDQILTHPNFCRAKRDTSEIRNNDPEMARRKLVKFLKPLTNRLHYYVIKDCVVNTLLKATGDMDIMYAVGRSVAETRRYRLLRLWALFRSLDSVFSQTPKMVAEVNDFLEITRLPSQAGIIAYLFDYTWLSEATLKDPDFSFRGVKKSDDDFTIGFIDALPKSHGLEPANSITPLVAYQLETLLAERNDFFGEQHVYHTDDDGRFLVNDQPVGYWVEYNVDQLAHELSRISADDILRNTNVSNLRLLAEKDDGGKSHFRPLGRRPQEGEKAVGVYLPERLWNERGAIIAKGGMIYGADATFYLAVYETSGRNFSKLLRRLWQNRFAARLIERKLLRERRLADAKVLPYTSLVAASQDGPAGAPDLEAFRDDSDFSAIIDQLPTHFEGNAPALSLHHLAQDADEPINYDLQTVREDTIDNVLREIAASTELAGKVSIIDSSIGRTRAQFNVYEYSNIAKALLALSRKRGHLQVEAVRRSNDPTSDICLLIGSTESGESEILIADIPLALIPEKDLIDQ